MSPFTVVAANGIDVLGAVDFDEGRARKVVLRHARWERMDIAALVDFNPDGSLSVDITGASLDARELVGGKPSAPDAGGASAKAASPKEDQGAKADLTPLRARARVLTAWVSDDGAITDVSALAERDHRFWRQARIDAKVNDKGKSLLIELNPEGSESTRLMINGGDAGAILRDLGITEDVVGGALSIDGHYADSTAHRPLSGLARITDFNVVHAPGLLRLLNVLGLAGIASELQGQGINFTTLDAPFAYTDDDILTLHDSQVFGTALGLTVGGSIDIDDKTLALDGTIVPFSAINSAFDNVPVIGRLLSPEKGGGVFSMGFTMKGPMESPVVTPNPFSVLTPGFLRGIFDWFGRGTATTDVRPKPEPAPH